MLEANKINPNVLEDNLTMTADEDNPNSEDDQIPTGERVLKGLTIEVSFHFSKFQVVVKLYHNA